MNGIPYELPVLRCLRCGETWHPKQPQPPRYCAKCHSTLWDVPPSAGNQRNLLRVIRRTGEQRKTISSHRHKNKALVAQLQAQLQHPGDKIYILDAEGNLIG